MASLKHLAPRPPIDRARFVPFSATNRRRQIVAALVVMAGAIPVGLVANSSTATTPRLYLVVLAVGIIGTLAWLIDGCRYLGAGLGALGLGTALTLVRHTTVDPYFLIFGLVGVALLVVSKVNPMATSGTAGLLIFVALAARSAADGGSAALPKPVTYAVIMIVWGGSQLRRTLRSARAAPEEASVVGLSSSR